MGTWRRELDNRRKAWRDSQLRAELVPSIHHYDGRWVMIMTETPYDGH